MALPTTYKKMVATKFTWKFRETAKIVTATLRSPAEEEVVVKVKFAAVTPDEANITTGRFHVENDSLPIDIGFEGTGTVVSIGAKVTNINIGQTVYFAHAGAYSEYLILKKDQARPLPISEPKAEIMPLLGSGVSAAIALDKVGEIKEGEKVLVTSAAGSTGSIAVQWAKAAGCHVIGTCSSDEKVAILKQLGCDRPINIVKEDLNAVLKKEFPNGVDVVYETVGGEMLNTCADNLAVKGRLVSIGTTSGYNTDGTIPVPNVSNLLADILVKAASIRGFNVFVYMAQYYKDYFLKLMDMYHKGSVKPLIDNGISHPKGPFRGLECVCDAVDYLRERKAKGKVIVQIQ